MLMENGEYRIGCRNFMTEPEFLATFGSRARRIVWIDPRLARSFLNMPSSQAVRDEVEALDAAYEADPTYEAESKVFGALLGIGCELAGRFCELVEGMLPEQDSGDEIAFMIRVRAGGHEYDVKVDSPLDGRRFVVDEGTRPALNGEDGVYRIVRHDHAGNEIGEAA